ncbi:hypothetical protein D3C81_1128960 [compost metagenome]
MQLHTDAAVVIGQAVVHLILQARLHAFEHVVKVVLVEVDELALLELGQWLVRLAAQVGQHAGDEGQLFLLDGITDFHVVGQLHPRCANPVELVLGTFLRHEGHLHTGPGGVPEHWPQCRSWHRQGVLAGRPVGYRQFAL